MTVFGMWLRSLFGKADIPFSKIAYIKSNSPKPDAVIDARIRLARLKIDIPVEELVKQQKEGGDLSNLAKGLIGCHIGKIDKSQDELFKMDRDGVDLYKFVGEQLGANVKE